MGEVALIVSHNHPSGNLRERSKEVADDRVIDRFAAFELLVSPMLAGDEQLLLRGAARHPVKIQATAQGTTVHWNTSSTTPMSPSPARRKRLGNRANVSLISPARSIRRPNMRRASAKWCHGSSIWWRRWTSHANRRTLQKRPRRMKSLKVEVGAETVISAMPLGCRLNYRFTLRASDTTDRTPFLKVHGSGPL